jgi:hypothetical protein
MPQPTMRYFLNTPVNEILQSCLATEPQLKETAPEITKKLLDWMKAHHVSAQGVTVAVIHILATGTEEGQKLSQE